ncbi:hypothetical protein FN846DRAFT_896677 [Sphaerosporella brunnea]|uniref:Uncharacterized protein n=1 Tax=Sphaerosporella brunnea TaxID=1250544 RepID=A0A5J5EB56_9PEZI|nr:hypothetical protein FN846DRAFT_896677 [Sphaerosporella brunnea]
MSTSDLVIITAPVTSKAKSPSANHKPAFIHRGHHCPVCKHAIPANGDQVKRCLKVGHVEECPYHPGQFNAVGSYGRRGCPACLEESRAAERKKAAEKKAEDEKRRNEEEKDMWSRKRRRSITPEPGSDTSNSPHPKKKKKRVNKKVRR